MLKYYINIKYDMLGGRLAYLRHGQLHRLDGYAFITRTYNRKFLYGIGQHVEM